MQVFLLRFWIAGKQGGLCYASLKGEDCCQLVSLFRNTGEGVYVGSENMEDAEDHRTWGM
jgi:hypothetical protein